jgi:tetratricopeptide (TPR) repeat protein/O-antigen ligase
MGRVKRRRTKKSTPLPLVLETTLEVLVIFILGFTPLAFGTVHPWSKLIFVSACLALGVVGVLLCRAKPSPEGDKPTPGLSAELCIGLAFLGLLLVQIVPLPKALVSVISPGTISLMEQWLAPGPVPDWVTLSLYPLATRLDLSIVAGLCIFFWVLTTHFSSSEKIRRVLLVAAFIGAIVGFIALSHQLLGLRKIFGIVKVSTNVTNGGVFVNSNTFGQFALLALGLTAGAAIYQQRRIKGLERSLKKQPSDDTIQKLKDQRILRAILLVGGVILILAILGSTSRASAVGLFLGCLLCGMFLVRRVTNPLTLGVWAAGLIAVIFFLSLTSIETIFDQVQDVDSAFHAFSHRTKVAFDLIREWQAVPVFGAGQGTHTVVYPVFQSFLSDKYIEYGDMDYFQFLAENGLVGVALLLSFFAVAFWRALKTISAHKHRLQVAAIGLTCGLLGAAIVSMTDFGQRFPGVSAFTVLSLAMLVNLHRLRTEEDDESEAPETVAVKEGDSHGAGHRRFGLTHGVIACALLVVGLAGIWIYLCNWQSSRWTRRYQAADKALRAAPFPAPKDFYQLRLDCARKALEWEPGNVVHAANYFNTQWLTLCDMNAIDERILTRESAAIEKIYSQTDAARRLGPSYARLPSIMGYMDAVRGKKEQALALVELSVKLSHSDSAILFDAGAANFLLGQDKRSTELFSDALICSSGAFFPDLHRLLLEKSTRPDLFLASVPDNMVVATMVYRKLSPNDKDYRAIMGPLRRMCIASMELAIKDHIKLMTPERFLMLARLYSDEDQPEKTIAILDKYTVGTDLAVAQRLKLYQFIRLGKYPEALAIANRVESGNTTPIADAIRDMIAQQAATQPAATKPSAK